MERRFSYRCTSQRLAVLKIGRRKVLVTIIDESASGFGVLIDGSCRCNIGQELSLKISSGWTPTRVTNVAYVGKTADVGGTRHDELQTRLGLVRLDFDQQLPKGPGVLWFAPSKLTVSYSFLATVGIAIGSFATVYGFAWALERLQSHVVVATLEPQGATSAEEFATTPRKVVAKRAEGPGVANGGRRPTVHTPRATEIVLIRSQPALLLKPEVVQLLDLDPKQCADLRRMMKERDEIGSIGGIDSQARDLRIGRASLDVLNDKQRQQWILLQLSNSSPDAKI